MATAAGACCKPEREGFERTRVIAGGFKPFCVHCPFEALRAAFLIDHPAGYTGSLGQNFSNAFLVADHFGDGNSSVAIAEVKFETFGVSLAGKILFL